MKMKSAMMVAPGSFVLTSDAGHTVNFKAGVETFVPAVMVRLCRQYGAKEVKRFSDTEIDIPGPAANVTGSIHLQPRSADMTAVEEVTMAEVQKPKEPEQPLSRYTAQENRVRKAISTVLTQGSDDDVTEDGVPKIQPINKLMDKSISAETRDAVWAKMKEAGEVPESDDG